MNHDEAEARVNELVDQINAHRRAYYEGNTVLISDADYDALLKELEHLENQYPELITGDSPTQTVGGQANQAFSPVAHLERMMSLDNVFSKEELTAWIQKTTTKKLLVELKIDGLAINLRYGKRKTRFSRNTRRRRGRRRRHPECPNHQINPTKTQRGKPPRRR